MHAPTLMPDLPADAPARCMQRFVSTSGSKASENENSFTSLLDISDYVSQGERMTITHVKATEISPLHDVEHQDLYAQLVTSLYRNGWMGRPILAAELDGEICALTGSHRIAAARHNDMDVPVYLVKLSRRQIDRCLEGFQDDRLAVIQETGDAAAIALFELELEEGR
jgi:hypothetical protein